MTKTELLAMAKTILFNTEMVRAILDGRKTVTRRVVKKAAVDAVLNSPARLETPNMPDEQFIGCLCDAPYEVGDYLYVRETWCWCPCWDCGMNIETGCCDDTANKFYNDQRKENGCYGYKVSFETGEQPFDQWHPSIHMPKEAARLFLRVTDMRVKRLQDITEEQIKAEGTSFDLEIYEMPCNISNAAEAYLRGEFMRLWNSTVKKPNLDCYSWSANPWVWVIEFERVNIDDRLTSEKLDYEMIFCNECPYYGEPNRCNRPDPSCEAFDYFTSVYEKLQKLEDAEEQRRLVELPIAVEKKVDELDRLQQENEQLREVLRLAVEDMSNIKLATQCINCFLCLSKAKSRNETFLPCGGCSSWQWRHADKLQELRVEK